MTGGGRGLGKGFALALAEAGADVAVIDINGPDAEACARDITAGGKDSFALSLDLSKPESPEIMVETILERWGCLDIAVNNAGIAPPIMNAEDVKDEHWQKTFALNLNGTFLCARAEAETMKKSGYGKIVNIASICGHIVWPEPQAAYSISKAGVIHMTKCLAAEWIRYGIRVNSISPGVTRTPELFPEVVPVFLRKAPTDRVADVEDITGAAVFLSSPASDFIVGQDIVVDGGYTLI